MASHKIQLTYDDASGILTVTHRTTVELGGHRISHAEPVALPDEAGAVAALKALLVENAAEMEHRATAMAIGHVAALNKTPRKGLKHLTVGGSLGALGNAEPKKV